MELTMRKQPKYRITYSQNGSGVDVTYYTKSKTISISGWYDHCVGIEPLEITLQDFVEQLNLLDDVVPLQNKWRPIESAPKDRTILIRERPGFAPDLVRWHKRIPERRIDGTLFLARPAGWFREFGTRTHIQNPTEWADIPD